MSTTSDVTLPVPPPNETGPGFDFLTWFELNRPRIIAGVGVVVVGVLVFLFIRWQHEQSENAASSALSTVLNGSGSSSQPTGAALLALADAHSGTKAAERARLLGAGRLYVEGKYGEAQTQFDKFTIDYPESPLLNTALLGLASSLDSQNKTNEALTAYQRLISTAPNDPISARARLSKARIHEALNQAATAVALYDELSRSQTAGELGQEAAVLRARLVAAHPELDTTPTLTNSVRVTAPPAKP